MKKGGVKGREKKDTFFHFCFLSLHSPPPRLSFLHLLRKLPRRLLWNLYIHFGMTVIWLQYCKDQDRRTLVDLFYQDDQFMNSGNAFVQDSYSEKVSCKVAWMLSCLGRDLVECCLIILRFTPFLHGVIDYFCFRDFRWLQSSPQLHCRDVFRLENEINPCERMVGSNLVYFERQEEPRIRVATLICNLTRTFLVFKLETFSKIRSIQPVISTTHALIVAVHFFVVNSGPQYMQRPRHLSRHKTTSYLLFFTGIVQRTKRARLKIAALQERPSREGFKLFSCVTPSGLSPNLFRRAFTNLVWRSGYF